ncbi:MAG: hypothetical protein M1826_002086 [Phylliscum demangeonii]|nr:MAG: hypothetical protein M1826_002086 [Phylliscum demangeonii]
MTSTSTSTSTSASTSPDPAPTSGTSAGASGGGSNASGSIYDFSPLDSNGHPYALAQHRHQVLLITNVASHCSFTPQYEALQALHGDMRARFGAAAFTVLAFPCNQFGAQEPGDAASIQDFCRRTYAVSFPVLGKVEVNGEGADPVWRWLKEQQPGLMGLRRVKWNFEKFLGGGA